MYPEVMRRAALPKARRPQMLRLVKRLIAKQGARRRTPFAHHTAFSPHRMPYSNVCMDKVTASDYYYHHYHHCIHPHHYQLL